MAPATLAPATGRTPAGFRRVTCDLTTRQGPVALVLDLPENFRRTSSSLYSARCTYVARGVRVSNDMSVDGEQTGRDTYEPEISVSVRAVGNGHALADADLENDLFLETEDQPFGDDTVERSDLLRGVPTFGSTIGDRLDVDCYCDGQNTLSRSAEAAGILVQWFSVQQLAEQTDAQWARTLATSGAG